MRGDADSPLWIKGMDTYWNAVTVEDTSHKRVHEGVSYFAGYLWGEGNNVADDASADLLIVTGDSTPHMIFNVFSGGASEFVIYEGVTTSSDGTALTEFNAKRSSTNTPTVTTFHTPTVTDTGTAWPGSLIPGGTGGHAQGGGDGFNRERNLKQNTKYLIRVTNRAGKSQPISIGVEWYEN